MADSVQTRVLRVQSEERGAAQVAAALQKVAAGATEADKAVQKYAADAAGKIAPISEALARSQDDFSKATLSTARAIQNLERRIDPVARALNDYERAQKRVNLAIDQGQISASKGAQILAGYEQRYIKASSASDKLGEAVNDNTRVFRLNRMGMMELQAAGINSFQALAAGMDPLRVAMMEGSQVMGAFVQGTEGGFKGLVSTVVGGARSIAAGVVGALGVVPTIGIGLAALGTAGFIAFEKITNSVKSADDILKEHKAWVDEIAAAYPRAAEAAKKYDEEASKLPKSLVQSDADKIAKDNQKAYDQAIGSLQSFIHMARTSPTALATFGQASVAELKKLDDGIQSGNIDARKMGEAIGNWQIDQSLDPMMKELGKTLDPIVKNAIKLEGALKGTAAAISTMSGGRMVPKDLEDMFAYQDQQAATLYRLRQQQAASLGAIGARSPAERAAAARASVLAQPSNDNESEAIRQYRAASAAALAYAQAENALKDAQEGRQRALDRTIAEEKMNLGLIGQSTAATAAMRLQFQLTSQLEEEAARNHIKVNQAELDSIKQKAAEYGKLAAQEQAAQAIHDQQLSLDLARAELSLVGQSVAVHDQVIARLKVEQQIRELGIDANGKQAQQLRDLAQEQAAYNTELQKSKAAFDDVKKTGESTIDSIENSLLNGGKDWKSTLLDISKTLTKSLVDLSFTNPLKDKLYGEHLPTMQDVGGIGGFFKTLFGGGPAKAGLTERGATPFNPMWVKSADTGIPGLPGLPGGKGGNPLGDLLKGYRPGDVTSSPLGANDNLSSYAKAIKSIESSGNYSALGPLTASGDRAYGAYQVMGSNIGPWTKQALGTAMTPDQFLASPSAQDSVFNKIFGGYASRFGANGAAQAWFGGPGSVGHGGVMDILGTTGLEYVRKFDAALGRLTSTTIDATSGLGQFGNSLMNFFPAAPGAGPGNFLKNAFNAINPVGWLQQASLLATSPQAAGLLASGAVGLFADGTDFAPGGPAIVGERGPELVNLPRGSQVIPNHKLQAMRPANQNAQGTAAMAAAIGKHIQVHLKNVNVFDPSIVGDYLRTDEGQHLLINVARENGVASR